MKLLVILLSLIIFIISISNLYLYYYIPRPAGLVGLKGVAGDKGNNGDDGDIGEKGLQGYRGPLGIKGKDVGLQGIKGDKGIRGIQGEKGDKGLNGLKGDPGEKGPPGIKGDQGFSGKTGLEGPQGYSREISNIKPIDLIADRTKCVQIYANGSEMKCPSNMAIFDVKAKKISSNTEDSELERIICCEFKVEDEYSKKYFDKTNILGNLNIIITQLKAYESAFVSGNKIPEYLKIYDTNQRAKIRSNIDVILVVINAVQNNITYREIPISNMIQLIGDENVARLKKVYTEDEISNMIATSGSITNHEWYILNLMNGLITRKERKQETPIDTTDSARLIKEIYDFPKNDVGALEEKVKI